MARAPFQLYEGGRSAPNPTPLPALQAPDQGGSQIGAALSRAGQSLGAVADANLARDRAEVELLRMQMEQEEDDARVFTASTMANARAHANELRRSTFANAQDGWRGATDAVANGWRAHRAQALAAAPTQSAQRFLGQAFDMFEPDLLDDVAQEEMTARRAWRLDTTRAALDQAGSALAADPRQYEAVRAQNIELIATMSDLSADQRRDLSAHAEETFARTAVAGLIEANPSRALAMLRDPEAGGPFARIDGPTRTAAINQAQSEMERRASRYRANVRERVEAAEDAWESGLIPSRAPSVAEVRSALGPDAARAYGVRLTASTASAGMQGLTNAQLGALATRRPASREDNDANRDTLAQAAAAALILQQRDRDPAAYALRAGVMGREQEIQDALSQGQFDVLAPLLRERGTQAAEQAARLGTDRNPLTRAEAAQTRALLDRMTTSQRAAALAMLSRSTRANGSYEALAAQLYPESPAGRMGAIVAAQHGSIRVTDRGDDRVTADQAARRLMEGERILRGGSDETHDTTQAGAARRQARPDARMPSEEGLMDVFDAHVGDAYAGRPEAYEATRAAFRAYYAGAAAERGIVGGGVASDGGLNQAQRELAREAARVAAGRVIENPSGSRALLPWGMSPGGFRQSLETAWPAVREAYGADLRAPTAYDYRFLGRGDDGGHLYGLFRGETAVQGRNGAPVQVRVYPPGQRR